MNINELYYTFSTIPQVLGALIALLGAFWVFKVQALNKKMKAAGIQIGKEIRYLDLNDPDNKDNRKEKQDNWDDTKKGLKHNGNLHGSAPFSEKKADEWLESFPIRMQSSIQLDDFEWIKRAIIIISTYAKNASTTAVKNRFNYLYNSKKEFTFYTRLSIILSLLTILSNVISLPFVCELSVCQFNAIAISCINLILFLISISVVGFGFYKSLEFKF